MKTKAVALIGTIAGDIIGLAYELKAFTRSTSTVGACFMCTLQLP